MGGGDADAGGEPAAAQATLHIRCTNGSKFAVRADLGATVGTFKAIVADSCDVPAPQQRLIYKGRILKDEQTLASYGACFALPLSAFYPWCGAWFPLFCCGPRSIWLVTRARCDVALLILPGWCAMLHS
jgi:hypothetical protein